MEDDQDFRFSVVQAAPALVSFSPFAPSISPSPRRLSSHFSERSRPVHAARRLSWVSLQGRLIGAEEASSARTIKGGLSKEEAVTWELFSPIHRILIVAVVAVAAADLKKSRQIWKLKRSVDLRDQILSSMQQKLDALCEIEADKLFTKNEEDPSEKTKLFNCGCRLCDRHGNGISSNYFTESPVEKEYDGDEMFKFKMPLAITAEQEERRMSDLSDMASSVTSAADIQLSTLAIEQDLYNLQRECQEKHATIEELKRNAELKDIIRRKDMVITKLKKDKVILEQQVVHLTRLRRPSFSSSAANIKQVPFMTDNVLYDMDSSTSPSSSDSDSTPENRSQSSVSDCCNENKSQDGLPTKRNPRPTSMKTPISFPRPSDPISRTRPVTPLKEKSMNQRLDRAGKLRPKQSVSVSGDNKKNRRLMQTISKDMTPSKRWA